MIFGIGVDMVKISRIERTITKWGDRFVDRVFSTAETEHCYARVVPYSSFALRFAAKEAFSKAIGVGMRKGIRWRDIEVTSASNGKPGLKLRGKAKEMYDAERINGLYISLSDEGDYGVAVVVLEK